MQKNCEEARCGGEIAVSHSNTSVRNLVELSSEREIPDNRRSPEPRRRPCRRADA